MHMNETSCYMSTCIVKQTTDCQSQNIYETIKNLNHGYKNLQHDSLEVHESD